MRYSLCGAKAVLERVLTVGALLDLCLVLRGVAFLQKRIKSILSNL